MVLISRNPDPGNRNVACRCAARPPQGARSPAALLAADRSTSAAALVAQVLKNEISHGVGGPPRARVSSMSDSIREEVLHRHTGVAAATGFRPEAHPAC